ETTYRNNRAEALPAIVAVAANTDRRELPPFALRNLLQSARGLISEPAVGHLRAGGGKPEGGIKPPVGLRQPNLAAGCPRGRIKPGRNGCCTRYQHPALPRGQGISVEVTPHPTGRRGSRGPDALWRTARTPVRDARLGVVGDVKGNAHRLAAAARRCQHARGS